MSFVTRWRRWGASAAVAVGVPVAVSALASRATEAARAVGDVPVRVLHFSDTHGKLAPHWERFADGRWHPQSGGFAKLAAKVKGLRASAPGASLLLANGDNFHGGAELLFTRGRAVAPILNALGIDAYSPGNWDFADGPAEFRARFAGTAEKPPLVRFPVLAAGVYNADGAPAGQLPGTPVLHDRFLLRDAGGVKVGIIGLNDDKAAEQAAVYTMGLEVRAGWSELPGLLEVVRRAGAELVIVMSDAGLAQNLAIARDVPGIDVLLSADTHEVTLEPLIVAATGTIVVESGEGSRLGQLDLTIAREGGKARIAGHRWTLHELDERAVEDAEVSRLVAEARAPFLSGPSFVPHVREVAGYSPGKGVRLTDPVDTVVGRTDSDLERWALLDGLGDNVIADALLELSGADIAASNGFRFDVGIPAGQPMTVADVYHWMPVAAQVAVGEMTGGQVLARFERYLASVLDPNPYRRGGGWVPRVAGVRFFVDFTRPHGPADRRIVKAEVFNRGSETWEPLVEDRVYNMASCYAPGDPLDRLCRTDGVRNIRFLTRTLQLKAPLVAHQKPNPLPKLQAAPDDAISLAELLLAYISRHDGLVRGAEHSAPRWIVVAGQTPKSDLLPNAVQPLEGSGPAWLAAAPVSRTTVR